MSDDPIPTYDRNHPYYNAEHPDHTQAVEAVREGFRRSTPARTVKGGIVEEDAQPAPSSASVLSIKRKDWLEERPSSPGPWPRASASRSATEEGTSERDFSRLQAPRPDEFQAGSSERWSEDTTENFTATVQAVGLSAGQVQEILDAYRTPGQPFPEVSPSSITQEQGEQALRDEWGDDFTYRLKLAQWAVDGLDPRVGEFLVTTGLANEPKIVKFFSREGARATAQIIMSDRTHPARDSGARGHAKAVEWLQRLFTLAE